MPEHLLPETPLYKLYKDRTIYIGTILGGPIAAGYMAAENFKHLGEPTKARNTWIIAILTTILLFAAAILIPGFEKVPNMLIPLAYTGIAYALVQQFQGKALQQHTEQGGQVYSIGRGILVGIIGLLILLALIFIYVFFFLADEIA